MPPMAKQRGDLPPAIMRRLFQVGVAVLPQQELEQEVVLPVVPHQYQPVVPVAVVHVVLADYLRALPPQVSLIIPVPTHEVADYHQVQPHPTHVLPLLPAVAVAVVQHPRA